MRRKKIDFMSVTWAIVTFCTFLVNGKPLDPADVSSLLPATPQTVNDTLAAIVQDPVIKDAVQYAVGNGSLSGLVVKKNVVVLPANAPDTVLSHTEQILTVPPEHLEDVRKNITEEAQVEINEGFHSTQSTFLNHWQSKDDYTATESESNSLRSIAEFFNSPEEKLGDVKNILPNDAVNVKPEVPLPEGVVTEKLELPPAVEDKVSVPVVAVLDPSKSAEDKVEGSIIALLPNTAETTSLRNQLEFLDNNRNRITEEIQSSLLQSQPESNAYRMDDMSYLKEPSDLDVAEDIVFRPLFRYRQEAQHRTSYRDYDGYRKSSYQRYGGYDQYNNYGPYRKSYYRYKPRYYNDYE